MSSRKRDMMLKLLKRKSKSYWHEEIEWSFLEKLVRTKSASGNFLGVNKVQEYLQKKFSDLNLTAELIPNRNFISGELLKVSNPKADTNLPKIILIAHADTVIEPSTFSRVPWKKLSSKEITKDHKFIYPTIIDNKSGIYILYQSLKKIIKALPHCHIEAYISPNEEVGSPGFTHYFKEMGQDAALLLGFEPSMPSGELIRSRNGNYWLELAYETPSGHSGRAAKNTPNAALMLCEELNYWRKLVQTNDLSTMQVGELKGGEHYNIICPKASAKVDFRFKKQSAQKEIEEKIIEDIVPLPDTVSRSLKITDFCPSMSKNEQTLNFLHSLNLPSVHSGGSADINHFYHPDCIAIDGLGPIGGNMHRKDEYLIAESLITKPQLVEKMVTQFMEYKTPHLTIHQERIDEYRHYQ